MKSYIFTFGDDSVLKGRYIEILAPSVDSARQKMFEMYGGDWAFCYEKNDYDRMTLECSKLYGAPIEEKYGETIKVNC